MSLTNRTLSQSIMSGKSAADEQEAVRLRTQDGNEDVLKAYERGGNMQVAKTLAHYQRGGVGLQLPWLKDKLGDFADWAWDRRGWGPGGGVKPEDRGKIKKQEPDEPYVTEHADEPLGPEEDTSTGIAPWDYPVEEQEEELVSQDPRAMYDEDFNYIGNRQLPEGTIDTRQGYSDIGYTGGPGGGITPSLIDVAGGFERQDTPGTREIGRQNLREDLNRAWEVGKDPLAQGVETMANILPNILNIKDIKKTPGVPAPSLGKVVSLMAPSFESERQAILGQSRNMMNRPGATTADRAAAMAKTQSALSRLGGQEKRMATQVQNTNRLANTQMQMSNLNKVNQYYKDKTARDIGMTRAISAQRTAIGEKALSGVADYRQRELDKDRWNLTQSRFNQNQELDRFWQAKLQSSNPEDQKLAMQYYANRNNTNEG